ncbi:hypothetical protein [Streptomyces sp. NPDC058385]|uniref:hypothetical protein n=1 Tax=Streptomyces sp. NPDC058385 TaxID=3346473 RepID=UPI00366454A5
MPTRTAPLDSVAGLTLAEDLRALHPLPSFDTAAMDGYAVAAGPGTWCVRGVVRACRLGSRTRGGGVRGNLHEDAPAGSRLAPEGARIGPALVGLAASCGRDSLAVRPRPRVGALITGDELDDVGRPGPSSGR